MHTHLQFGKGIDSHLFKVGQAGIFLLLGAVVMYLSFKEDVGTC
jgi:hypothetical protein